MNRAIITIVVVVVCCTKVECKKLAYNNNAAMVYWPTLLQKYILGLNSCVTAKA